MKRSINLYHPSLLPSKERLPLKNVLWVNGAALVLLLALTVGMEQFIELKQRKSDKVTASVKNIDDEINALTDKLAAKRDTQSVQKDLDSLRVKVKNREQLLDYMQTGELSLQTTQYQNVMDDLANFHNPNLWLTSITITRDELRLTGNTIKPSAIPQWLQKLQGSTFFKGKTFSTVNFENESDDSDVKTFTLSTDFDGEADDTVAKAL
ncbi:PilN domain-containing protein [Alteromonas sp. BMJM2]|uniref:PilN domain-containing protein n=1 Tax=Alteromonas sp. BMJM2 TaxID=2954241 RepID=UPI0022B498E6|nr:PilN domain-containing protein [Alteromonas sp. BMJM2]